MEKSQYSILCIEDNQIVREKLVELLRSFFHTVYSASSAEEAIPLYQRNKPEIILTDINLPGISGMDLAKKIREKDLSTKVIILTAHMSDELLLAASELKLTKYLLKPVTYKALKEALKLAIDELESIEIVYKKLI